MSGLKRRPSVGKFGQSLHDRWSKATIHEALLDFWMESEGKYCSPDDLTAEDWAAYQSDVERRSSLLQGTSGLGRRRGGGS
jgi:hypothetical protein